MSDTDARSIGDSTEDTDRAWLVKVLKVGQSPPGRGPVIGGNRAAQNAPQQPLPPVAQPPIPQRSGITLGTARSPENRKALFDTEIVKVNEAVQIARNLAPASVVAVKAKTDMVQHFSEAVAAAKAGKYESGIQLLAAALQDAETVSRERLAARDACRTRLAKLEGDLAALAGKLAGIGGASAKRTKALQDAAAAQKAASEAADADPEDWPAASAKLDVLDQAIAAIAAACGEEVQALIGGLDTRFTPLKDVRVAGAASLKARAKYLAALKAVKAKLAAGQGDEALVAYGPANTALTEYEAAAKPSDLAKTNLVSTAKQAVRDASGPAIASQTLTEKATLVLDMCANGRPNTVADQKLLVKVYDNTVIKQAFNDERDVQRAAIADGVAKLEKVKELTGGTPEEQQAKWDVFAKGPGAEARVLALLQEVGEKQMEILGLPKITIKSFSTPRTNGRLLYGQYNPKHGATPQDIDLNVHSDAMPNLRECLTTVLHETFHAHQFAMIDQLQSGEIGPDDPRFDQAMMFLANAGGYIQPIPPDITQANYERQPVEIDAETQGKEAAIAVLEKTRADRAAAQI